MKIIKRWIYGYLERNFFEGCSKFNPLSVRKASRTKELARSVFEKNNIPHAKGDVFINPWRAVRFVKKNGFPIVLKPNFGTFSRGSFFPIENWKAFYKYLFIVKLYWPKTIIETYLNGKDYRVVVIEGKTMVVAHRTPPTVTGDGEKNIEQLIDKENQIRKKMKLLPVIFEIKKEEVKKFIKKQKLTLTSIPKKDEKIELGNLVALWAGGVLQDVPLDKIPKKNHDLFQKVLRAFDSRIFGLDFICEKSIEVPWDEQKCIFLEANSRPYLKMHDYPRWGQIPDFSADIKKLKSMDNPDSDIF